MPESTRSPFSYAIIRIVPRIERGEQFNAGVVLYCRQLSFLKVKVALDLNRLRALAPELDAVELRDHLQALVRVADGADAGGPVAKLPPSERFGWIVAPSSTVLQPSTVHTGLTDDPDKTLANLFRELVEPLG